MAASETVTRFGVAGAGSLGFHHTRILRDLPNISLAGFYDSSLDRAREVEGELGVTAHPSLDDLLSAVDAIVVATPTTTHADVAEAALARGVHVFIEKPIASTLEEADRIIDAAERAGALVQVGHVERFNAAVIAARPYLDDPLFVESHRLAPFTERGTDVAVVLDLMIHDVDLVASLVGHPLVDFQATGIPVLTPSVDIANARLQFEGGAVANLTASRVSAEKMRKLRVFQRSGYLSLDLAAGTGQFLRLKGELPGLVEGLSSGSPEDFAGPRVKDLWSIVERIPLTAEPEEPLRRELESFRDAITQGGPAVVTAREGRDALATALAIEQRIMTHVANTSTA